MCFSRDLGSSGGQAAQALSILRSHACAVVLDLQAQLTVSSSDRNRAGGGGAVAHHIRHTLAHSPGEQLVDLSREAFNRLADPSFDPDRSQDIAAAIQLGSQ